MTGTYLPHPARRPSRCMSKNRCRNLSSLYRHSPPEEDKREDGLSIGDLHTHTHTHTHTYTHTFSPLVPQSGVLQRLITTTIPLSLALKPFQHGFQLVFSPLRPRSPPKQPRSCWSALHAEHKAGTHSQHFSLTSHNTHTTHNTHNTKECSCAHSTIHQPILTSPKKT